MTYNTNAQLTYDNLSEPECGDDEAGLQYLIDDAYSTIARAERALKNGDYSAAVDLLRSAGNDLTGAV